MIRFRKDDGSDYPEWEQKAFGDIFTMHQTNTFSRDQLNNELGDVQNIHYGDILVKFGSVIDCNMDKLPFVNEDVPIKKFINESYVRDGDIIVADTAEDYTAGKVSEVQNIGERKVLSGLHTMLCRPQKEFASRYLGYYLNSEQYHKQVIRLLVGTKVYSINKKAITDTILKYPCLEEQQKIADFLSSVDDVIAASEQEVATLEEQKKGVMQKIFSQEVRFKADDGLDYPEWEENKLGNYISLQGGYAFKSDMFVDNGIPIIRISNINNGIIDIKNDIAYYEEIDIDDRFIVTNGDLLIAMSGATTGKTGIYKEEQKSYLNQRVGNFVLNCDSLVYSFLYHWVNTETFSKQLRTRLAAGAQPNISPSDIESMKILVPQSLEEQQKIADFLSNFDAAIDFAKQELEQWKELKKGLLQQLFE